MATANDKKTLIKILKELGLSKPVIMSFLALIGYLSTQVQGFIIETARPMVQEAIEQSDRDMLKSVGKGFYRLERALILTNPEYENAFEQLDRESREQREAEDRINNMIGGQK